ncbi:MAG: DUF4326 domain-containing protein [Rhodospirillaceae bacterium]
MSTQPIRLQLSRRRGFDLQQVSRNANGLAARSVARPGPFGNPFLIRKAIDAGYASVDTAPRFCVDCFADWLAGSDRWYQGHESACRRAAMLAGLAGLAGHNLACWCPLSLPCHADVLLARANREPAP